MFQVNEGASKVAHEKVCEKEKTSKCPYCEGKGYTVGYDDYDLYRIQCPHCLGSGKKLLEHLHL